LSGRRPDHKVNGFAHISQKPHQDHVQTEMIGSDNFLFLNRKMLQNAEKRKIYE
jgi:hypothetical protein